MPRNTLRATTALAPALIALLAASHVQAATLWYSNLTYPMVANSANGTSGGTTSSGGDAQNVSATDMTNAAINTGTPPIPAGGGTSNTAPINQSLIQPGDQVIISQTVYGGTGGDTSAVGGVGGKGGNGTSVQDWAESNAASTSVATTGYGGNGGNSLYSSGGNGGNGVASSNVGVHGNLSSTSGLNVMAAGGTGGNGGSVGHPGSGGQGGTAFAIANGSSIGTSSVNVEATATGGMGGSSIGGASGNGGIANVANAFGSSGTGSVNVTATQQGGTGGNGLNGASGGTGANSNMTNVVSGSTVGSLNLTQMAYGGNGGSSDTGTNGTGGNASSSLGTTTQAYTDTTATTFSAEVLSQAGAAGNFYSVSSTGEPSTGSAPVAATANAYINAVATGVTPGGAAEFIANATGGAGGSSNVTPTNGGNATSTVLFTTTGSGVSPSSAVASGGTGGAYSGSGNGTAGNGGSAIANITGNFNGTGTATGPGGSAYNFTGAYANAGNGGTAYNFYFPANSGTGGTAGNAAANAYAASTTGQNLMILTSLNNTGGNGGEGGVNGVGGNGGSYEAVNSVSGSTTGMLYLQQNVHGGNGGTSLDGNGGNGGNAESDLTILNAADALQGGNTVLASNLIGVVDAFAGNGSQGGTAPGIGGNAISNISMVSGLTGTVVISQAYSEGGLGGYVPSNSAYGISGTANASAFASGVRGTTSNTVSTMASSPMTTGSPSSYQSAEATSASGGLFNNDIAQVDGVTLVQGRAISQGIVAPTNSLNNSNAASVTTSVMGNIMSSTSTPYNFTEVGAGYMGAQANGVTGANTYKSTAEFVLSGALVGAGNELLLGSGASYLNGTQQIGTGFNTLDFTITDKNSSGLFSESKMFTSYSAFATFLATGVDLGNAVSGTQDVTVSMMETLSGTNGVSAQYVLAVTPFANGGFTDQLALESISQTPLPGALPMFAVGLLAFGIVGYRKQAKSTDQFSA